MPHREDGAWLMRRIPVFLFLNILLLRLASVALANENETDREPPPPLIDINDFRNVLQRRYRVLFKVTTADPNPGNFVFYGDMLIQ